MQQPGTHGKNVHECKPVPKNIFKDPWIKIHKNYVMYVCIYIERESFNKQKAFLVLQRLSDFGKDSPCSEKC